MLIIDRIVEIYIFVMKLSIRLQNHGCANHPYWWIVVAPHRKNIKGRFIEHVGYWAPRQGALVDRQITLNMPRIKYWMGCGAQPTPKIQKFLSLWSILPKPFYPQRTPQQMAARRKPQSEWTDKDKIKQQRKRKRRQRIKLSYINYYAPMAKYKSLQTFHYIRHKTKLREKIQAAEKENQIIRELLLHNQYGKINRINELSGNAVLDDSQELLRLQQELSRAKAELALLDKNTKNFSPMHKTKIIKDINALVDKIREAERQRNPFRKRNIPATTGENITPFQIDRELQYELVQKKLQKMNKEMQGLDKLYETVTLEEYANYIQQQDPKVSPQDALEAAQQIFMQRGKKGLMPLTKFQIYYELEFANDPDQLFDLDNTATFTSNLKSNWKAKQAQKQKEEEEEQEQEDQMEEAKTAQTTTEKEGQQGQQENIQKPKRIRKVRPQFQPQLIKQHGIDLTEATAQLAKVHEQNLMRYMLTRPDVIVPTNRPVHPFPDLQTYVPEQYYEPITDFNLKIVNLQSLEPNDLLQNYNKKREYASNKSSKGLKTTPVPNKRAEHTL